MKHELSRTEIGRIADVIEVLVARHGSLRKCATGIGTGENILGTIVRRPAALNVLEVTLGIIATAAGGSVAELLAGKLQLEGPRKAPAHRPCVVGRRGAA